MTPPLPKFDEKAADAIEAFIAEKARWSKRSVTRGHLVLLIRRGEITPDGFAFTRFDVTAAIADGIIEQAAMRAAIEAGR